MRSLLIAAVFVCCLVIVPDRAFATDLEYSDIYITPKSNPDFFSGLVGGDGGTGTGEGIDWSIGNGTPYNSYGKDDLVFSTCIGNHSNATNWIERMRITEDGNVGIGTENPTNKLQVLSTDAPIAVFDNDSGDWVTIDFARQGEAMVSVGLVTEEGSGDIPGNAFVVGSNDGENWTDPLVIENGAPTGAIYVNADGNVGINTITPAGTLDVNGAIYQRGGQLHADYVFDTDYKLESIREHADYMWNNKHLKAIPKAMVDGHGREVVEVGAHRKGIVEELEKAHIYISQLEEQVLKLSALSTENSALKEHYKTLEGRIAKLEIVTNVEQ